jgi:hypothetical protein
VPLPDPGTGGTAAAAGGAGGGKPNPPAGTAGKSGGGSNPVPAAGGCDSCKAAAASGNASAVAAALGKCTDEAKKAECKAVLQRTAGGAVRLAANNGQCDRARALANAAAGLGIKTAANGLKGTSCQ